MKYIFVEGYDDSQFFKMLYKNNSDIEFIEYATKKKEYVNNYIKSIKSMPNGEYIFIADSDGLDNDKIINKIIAIYNQVEKDRLYITRYEIESWYLAGISEEYCKKHKFSEFVFNTDVVTKEIFNNMLPKRTTRLLAMIDILNNYNINLAKTRNNSFKVYINNEESSMAV